MPAQVTVVVTRATTDVAGMHVDIMRALVTMSIFMDRAILDQRLERIKNDSYKPINTNNYEDVI